MAEALLLQVGSMFAALAVASLAADRVDVSPIPLYVLAGMTLSEHVAGRAGLPWVAEIEFVTISAELGIVFLLLFLGLEFDLGSLVTDRARVGVAGTLDFVVNFAAGLALGYVVFGTFASAVVLAGVVYVSSSAIITKTLLDTGWIANPESAPILGTLVFEDLVVAVYLAVVTAVVLRGGSVADAAPSIGVAFGFLGVLAVLVAAGTPVLERFLDTRTAEFLVLRAVGATALVAGLALAVGVSEAVAAFFVGTAFGTTSFADDLETRLEPVRDVFAAVFFFWVGLLTDPLAVLGVLDLLAVLVAVSAPTKLFTGFYGGRAYGLSTTRSLRVGLAMVTRGEFSLVIAAAAVAAGGTTITIGAADTIYALTVGYVLAMSVLGTLLVQHAERIERTVLG